MDMLRAAHLRVHVMPHWHDVDTIEDLKALYERGRRVVCEGSRTQAYLDRYKDILF
jgi:hypothetical protein